MTDWNNKRPDMVDNISALGIGKAIYAAPDGKKETARLLIAADGFHFKNSDFDDLILSSLSLTSLMGSVFSISFSEDGKLLINGNEYISPTNQDDETVLGNKTYSGVTKLAGGLVLNSSGVDYKISVDETGNVQAKKILEKNEDNNGKTKNE